MRATDCGRKDNVCLLDLSSGQIERFLSSMDVPAFRGRQIENWIYQGLVYDFEQMTNLPVALRHGLAEAAEILPFAVRAEMQSTDGETRKVLLELHDGSAIEAVFMSYDPTTSTKGRSTVCVSTQAGCAVGCSFCATGRGGFVRNLSAGEIVGQVLYFAAQGGRITNVVFMGQGEPLRNFDAVWKAIEILNSSGGLGIAARHLTVSTAGIVPGIRRLSSKTLQVGLALSLHAPNDDLRNTLVPLNRKYPIRDLLSACWDYTAKTGRRVTFEYVLIRGVNDGALQARELGALLSGHLAHINLIPVNPVDDLALQPPTRQGVASFQAELHRKGITSTLRIERGQDILAACGQLMLKRSVAAG
ncbi:MAG: 23S rRNA (adenine(2503)-C(2))-methyltransferase RlmN [Dehalococcoidia bacterium]|nr:23S rRNA (adenine(2503)-C(2))-methyltransferase RlmN [Dehalococcoidia bacterium]